ncbi:hypothetical protein AB0B42_00615 [Streptomyces fradiae]|uniref:hypothetical protein n=1 Tax=Streptomyces fradiae TaxID=1906 RepID=UPI0033EBBB61
MSTAELPAEDAPAEDHDRPHLEIVPPPGRTAPRLPDLRPYLPTRTDLRAPLAGVGAGARVLARRGCAWIAKDGWIWEGWTKLGAVAGGVYVGLPAAWTVVQDVTGPYAAFVPTAAAVCGCIAAKRAAPARPAVDTPAAEELDDALDDEPEHPDDDTPDTVGPDDVAALIRAVAARHQHQGAHLEDLLHEPLLTGWDKADLKAALTEDWGLPVESFKLLFQTPDGKRQRVRDGVRLRHLPPAPTPGADEPPARALTAVPSHPPASTPPEAPAKPSPAGPAAPSQRPG